MARIEVSATPSRSPLGRIVGLKDNAGAADAYVAE
jgi:hypothetical protein